MDFFTVPTITFRVLYCFFVIEHGRRKILHFNVTEHPTSSWITQQLREAFPEPCPYRYALLDRDAKFGKDVTDLLISGGIKPKPIGYRCPWQNGIAERWIGSRRSYITLSIIRIHHDHKTGASRLERERSAKFTVIWVKTAVKSHSKIQRS
jgi:putative transposase